MVLNLFDDEKTLLFKKKTTLKDKKLITPPANEVAGVYSDPYVRPSVRSFLRPSVPPNLLSATPLRPLNRIS